MSQKERTTGKASRGDMEFFELKMAPTFLITMQFASLLSFDRIDHLQVNFVTSIGINLSIKE